MAEKKTDGKNVAGNPVDTEGDAFVNLPDMQGQTEREKALQGESLTTHGPDSFHESANVPVATTFGTIGRDPLHNDYFEPLGTGGVKPVVMDGNNPSYKAAAQEAYGKQAFKKQSGAEGAAFRQFADLPHVKIQIPQTTPPSPPYEGSINGVHYSIAKNVWIDTPENIVAELVHQGVIQPPNEDFQQYINDTDPAVKLAHRIGQMTATTAAG